jgi:hypothetical protein
MKIGTKPDVMIIKKQVKKTKAERTECCSSKDRTHLISVPAVRASTAMTEHWGRKVTERAGVTVHQRDNSSVRIGRSGSGWPDVLGSGVWSSQRGSKSAKCWPDASDSKRPDSPGSLINSNRQRSASTVETTGRVWSGRTVRPVASRKLGFTPAATFSMGLINRPPNRPFEVWRAEEKYQGCCYTILVISTCIVLSVSLGD